MGLGPCILIEWVWDEPGTLHSDTSLVMLLINRNPVVTACHPHFECILDDGIGAPKTDDAMRDLG